MQLTAAAGIGGLAPRLPISGSPGAGVQAASRHDPFFCAVEECMVAMRDPEFVRTHRLELSNLTGRFLTEHLVHVHAAFEGDLSAALVLGTIGQHYIQRFYDEYARDSAAGLDRLVDGGEHLSRVRACNAMSVSAATGIPRETVRRKFRWLVKKGWVAVGTRGQLTLVPGMSISFEGFDLETIARFHAASRDFLRHVDQRTSVPGTTRGADSR